MQGRLVCQCHLHENPSLQAFTKSQHNVILQQLDRPYISVLLLDYPHMPLCQSTVSLPNLCNTFYTFMPGPQTACSWQKRGCHHAPCLEETDHCTDPFVTSHSEKSYHFQILPSLPPWLSCTLYIIT